MRTLAQICTDDLIAGVLNRNGLLTGRGNRWTRERVTALRSHHKIPCFSAEHAMAEGWMNLTRAAAFLGVSPRTLRLAIDRSEIAASHPFADGPWVLNQRGLQTSTAAEVVRRAQHPGRDPTIPTDQQATFGFSTT